MKILPAIDIIGGQAVRLYKGDYEKMTVYAKNAADFARKFEEMGAKNLHLVDLDGAKSGENTNLSVIGDIIKSTSLSVEIGGGIRSMQSAEKYINLGADRIIIGTAAVTDPKFLREAIKEFGSRVAVGADLKDGYVAIRGWLEKTALTCDQFFTRMISEGVETVICTDVSRDGAMKGTNLSLYEEILSRHSVKLIASGGVGSIEDIETLDSLGVYGAIIGKAYYENLIDIRKAMEVARDY